jgi:Domain of unknown function (DUF4340)
MNRRNEILVATLVVQVILIVLLTTLRAPAGASAVKPLFPGIKNTDVVELTIQDNSKKVITLTKKDTNWVLPQSDDFPADNTKVGAFIDKLLKVSSGRLVAQTASSYTRLQVADDNYLRRVEFTAANGATHTLLIGSSPGAGEVHIRTDGASEVWLTDSLASQDAGSDAATWINPIYLTVQQDKVNSVVITNHNGTFQFDKDSSNAWKIQGLTTTQTLDQTKLTDLLSRVALLSMSQPVGKSLKPEYGLQSPTAVITLTLQQATASSKPTVLRVGAKDASDNTYVVGSSESVYYVRVSSFSLDDFVNHSQKDFLQIQPTAVPTGTVTPGQ